MLRMASFIIFIFYSIVGFAFNVDVNPVILKLDSNQQILSFKVTNKSSDKVTIQLRSEKWSQKDGVDSTIGTHDLIITPPFVVIPPHTEQIVRVGLRKPELFFTEKTYRVVLEQIVPPVNFDKVLKKNHVDMAFKFSLPLFVSPVKKNKRIAWEIKKINSDKYRLKLINKGNVHVIVSKLVLYDKKNPIYFSPKVSGRILGGRSQEWELSLTKPLTSKRIIVKTTTDWLGKYREINAAIPIKD